MNATDPSLENISQKTFAFDEEELSELNSYV